MLIQTCSKQNKQIIFDEVISNPIGQYLMIDSLGTFPEFCQVFDDNTKQIVSDDENELLMIYNTIIAPSPYEDIIIFTYIVPLNICFPSYKRPVIVMNKAITQVFNDFPDKDMIISILPNMPFIGQVLLMSGFIVIEDNIAEGVVMKDGEPTDGYCFIKHRIQRS
jgi:hypothetical protein